MKSILFIIAFLLSFAVCLGDVNQGIQSRAKWESFMIDSADTDTTEVIIDVRPIAEQGFATLVVKVDSTKVFNAWFSSGIRTCYWGCDTCWTDRVQCIFGETLTALTSFGPINVSFLQSEALVDTSDRSLGYLPADFFRFSISPASAAGDDIQGMVKVQFK